MPVGEVVGQVLVEIVLEVLIKGPGFFIARLFNPKADPDGGLAILAGVLFWICLGGLGYLAYRAHTS